MEEINNEVVTQEAIPESSGSEYDFDVTAGFGKSGETVVDETPVSEVEATESEVPTIEPEDRDISFTAKIDHNEQQVSIKESEIASYYQKASNMDRAVQRANEAQEKLDAMQARLNHLAAVGKATLGLEGDDADTILANMESGMTDTAIKSRARTYKNTDAEIAEAHVRSTLKDAISESETKFGVIKPAETTADTETPATEEQSVERPFEEFERDVQRLLAVRPDIQNQEFPSEVIGYYKGGMDIMTAFAKYESDKTAAENAELKKQNAVLQQNQASARKAPIRSGVSSTPADIAAEDPMTQGWERRRR